VGTGIWYPSASASVGGVIRVSNPSRLAPYLRQGESNVHFILPVGVTFRVDSCSTPGIFKQAIGSVDIDATAAGDRKTGSASHSNGADGPHLDVTGVLANGGDASLTVTIPVSGDEPIDIPFSVSVGGWTLDISYEKAAVAHIEATFSGLTDASGNPLPPDLGIEFLPKPDPPKDNTKTNDHKPKTDCHQIGMAAYNFHTMLASLLITDTPVGYIPPYGAAMYFTVAYTQRGTSQPSVLDFTNFGPKWNCSWLGYILDDATDATAVSRWVTPGGGSIPVAFTGVLNGFQTFQLVGSPSTQLRRAVANPLPLEILNPDGSKEVYGQSDGNSAGPRKVFLTQRIDSAGNITTLGYDTQHRLTKITDALGQETVLTYGLAADPFKVTKITDPFGRFAQFAYDANGRLVKITDVIGLESTFAYQGASSFISSLTTPYGTTTFTNTENGPIRRIMATDPSGDSEVVESNYFDNSSLSPFDSADSLPQGVTVFNSELNSRNSYYWDKKQWKEASNDYTKAHVYHWLRESDYSSMSGTLESQKPPLESRIWYNYPGQPRSEMVGSQFTPSKIGRVIEGGTQLTNRTITPLDKIASETDPLGRTRNWQFSASGFDLTGVTQSTSQGVETLAGYSYNAQHRPLTFTDAGAQVTNYTWNAVGQITGVKNARNETTSFSYYTSDATGKQRKGRLSQINGALPGDSDVVSFDYDAKGNVASVTGPDGYFLRLTYDALDRLTRVTFPDGTYTETTYLALDPQTSRDRLGRLTHYVYNSIRQLISVTDPAQRQVRYGYCDCGEMDQLIDAMGRITRWRHDIAGRVTAKVYADGSTVHYGYEPLSGRLSTITDEKKQVKTRLYNLDNTLAGINYTNAEHTTPNVAFTYNTDFRRLKSMADGIGTTNYAYYPIAPGTVGAGRLASVDGPLANDTLTYTYDELSRRTGYAINGVGETRSFDPLGRLLSATNPLGTFGYTYVGATSRMDKVTYPNGMTCQYNYHPLTGDFRLKDIIHTLPGNTLLSRHSYEYSAVGNITRWTQISPQAGLNRSWLCGYDNADQLTSVTSQDPITLVNQPTGQYAYGYDPASNRLTETIDGVTTTAHYNALNQLTGLEIGGISIPPDQIYEWDAEDRLAAIDYTGTSKRSEFQYDGYHRRARVIERDGSIVTSDFRHLWDNFQLREQRDSTATAVQKRWFGRGMQSLGSGGNLAPRMFTRDHLGSVRELVSGTTSLTGSQDFDPFGRRFTKVDSEEPHIAFTGHWPHEKSALVFAVYRVYGPIIGRWTNRDPIGESAGPNLYAYVQNNPIADSDVLGLLDDTLFHYGSKEYGGTWGFDDGNDTFDVSAHSGAGLGKIYDEYGRGYTPDEYYNRVKDWPDFKNSKRVKFWACQTATGGDDSFAGQFHEISGKPTIGATGDVEYPSGQIQRYKNDPSWAAHWRTFDSGYRSPWW
jgi:RHS repeat-associated protein